jgi:uncharacterized protein YggE
MSIADDNGNIISVTGYGRLFVDPNYLTVFISLGCRTNTMKASLDSINTDMKRLFAMVKSCKINKKYVNVVDLNFGPKYEWENNRRVFLGYEVTQNINIEMDATNENEEKVKKIISDITSLNYFIECNIEYGLKNKKKHLETVRKLSFMNAVEKAEQYAVLAGVKVTKVNTIKDTDSVGEYSRSNSHNIEYSIASESSETHLPKGRRIVLENTVYVTFDIEKK